MSENLYVDTDEYICHKYIDRDEWLKGRKFGIGGSSAASLIDQSKWKTCNTLWKEINGQIKVADISNKPNVKFGIEAEPLLRNLFALNHPEFEVQYLNNVLFRSKSNSFMYYSPDGLLIHNENGSRGIFEVKTTHIQNAIQKDTWNNMVPQEYWIQTLHGLLVLNFDFVYISALLVFDNNDGTKFQMIKEYHFTREEVMDQLLLLKEMEIEQWNKYFVTKAEPPIPLNI